MRPLSKPAITLAQALEATGRTEAAVLELNCVLSADPSHSDAVLCWMILPAHLPSVEVGVALPSQDHRFGFPLIPIDSWNQDLSCLVIAQWTSGGPAAYCQEVEL
jgi:hypothetical protein